MTNHFHHAPPYHQVLASKTPSVPRNPNSPANRVHIMSSNSTTPTESINGELVDILYWRYLRSTAISENLLTFERLRRKYLDAKGSEILHADLCNLCIKSQHPNGDV